MKFRQSGGEGEGARLAMNIQMFPYGTETLLKLTNETTGLLDHELGRIFAHAQTHSRITDATKKKETFFCIIL